MTLRGKEFHALRKKSITERRDRTYKRTRAKFEIIEEIAKALKSTTQVAGKTSPFPGGPNTYIVGRGRAVHLIAGPPAKKRKLNAMSNEDTMLINPETGTSLIQENA